MKSVVEVIVQRNNIFSIYYQRKYNLKMNEIMEEKRMH